MLKSLILKIRLLFSFVVVSHSVISDSLQPHGLQHTRLPCPSLTPRVCSNSCPLSWWCYPTLSASAALPPLPSIFPSIRVFSNESPLYIWWRGGQSIGTSASASVLSVNIHRYPMNIQWTIQFSSVAQSFPTLCDPWIAARQASLSITNSRSTPP